MGVCGKDNETALLQDLLVHAAKGIAMVMHRAGVLGVRDREIDRFIVEMLFTTVTNVNFDPIRIEALLGKAGTLLERAKSHYQTAAGKAGQPVESLGGAVQWKVPANRSEMLRQAEALSIAKKLEALGPDATGLQELIVYGLKGMAAYADHAMILGLEDDQVYDFFYEALDFLTGPKATDVDALVAMAMKVGQVNLAVMELLDKANTDTYGHPEPSVVRITPKKGKAILVSGHDLKDLEELLKQTAGKGINVYTHGEMLPCNAYPKLKKSASCRQLRRGLAGSAQRVRRLSGRDRDDDQLHSKAAGQLQKPHLYLWVGGLAGCGAYQEP